MIGHTAIRTLFCASLTISILSAGFPLHVEQARGQGASRKMNGFEVSGRFLEEWSRQGSDEKSIYVNGLPITARRAEISMEDGKLYDTQWFERARYEAHPQNKAPFDVLLGRLGYSIAEGRGKIDPATGRAANPGDQPFVGIDKPADADGKSKLWFQETRHTISGKLLEYWNRYGGLPQFGFPLSEPFQEVSQADGKAYTVQYFERNRMELHPEKPAPYDVELGLLGVEQFRLQAVAADQLPVAPPKDVKTTDDSIAIGMFQEPSNLSFADDSQAGRRIRTLIEDGLVGRDENDNLFPLNAWYVPTLENGGARFIGEGEDRYLQVKYKLRQGIKWSDGKELTSNDAIFAYRLLLDPLTPPNKRAEYLRLQNVDNPDRQTVIYNYRSPRQAREFYQGLPDKARYEFLKLFVEVQKPVVSRAYSEIGSVYPEHILGKIAPGQIPYDPVSRSPVGTGAWKIDKWWSRQAIVLVPNEHYVLTARPAIKTIRIVFVPNLNTAGWSYIRTREVDMLAGDLFNAPPADFESLRGVARVVSRPGSTWEHLDFSNHYAPFRDRAVREAIITAINRQRIVDQVYQGTARVMNVPVPSGVYYSLDNPDIAGNYPELAARYKVPSYAHDPERAKRLLDEAGWKVGPDGIRAKDGIRLSFDYTAPTNSTRIQIQTLVSADLRAVGIDVQQRSLSYCFFLDCEPTTFWSDGTIKLRQFASTNTRDSDLGEWVCERTSETAIVVENAYRFCDPTLKAAHDRFKSEIDLRSQIESAGQAQLILMQNIALVPLIQRPHIEIVAEELVNYKLPNSTLSSFWNARQWYFR